jgi:adenine phosphoribosyltransferase
MDRLARLRASLKGCPVVKFGEYNYFVHPITDGIPLGDPKMLSEVVDEMRRVGDFRCDKIITIESMGFPLAALLSVETGVPYVFIRKRQYGLPGEVSVQQVTGYSEKKLYINNIGKGDRVTFVDDVVSTGGSLRAVVKALRGIGAEIHDIVIVFEKTKRKRELESELGVRIKTLLGVDVVDGKVVEMPI